VRAQRESPVPELEHLFSEFHSLFRIFLEQEGRTKTHTQAQVLVSDEYDFVDSHCAGWDQRVLKDERVHEDNRVHNGTQMHRCALEGESCADVRMFGMLMSLGLLHPLRA
jgi:hypothetical protein